MSNIIIPSEESQLQEGEEKLAEIVGESELPDLFGVADKLQLLSNRPAPPQADWVQEALSNVGGRNKFGEPNFRAVWGQGITHFAWGQQRMKYPATFVNEQELLGHDIHNANGKVHFVKGNLPDKLKPGSYIVPRYRTKKLEVGLPFWIIERWHDITEYFQPKGFFHSSLEEAWDKEVRWDWDIETAQRVDNMGPFPSRGVYLHFFTVKTPDFQYRPVQDDVVNVIATTLRVESQVASGREYKIALREELEKQMAARRKPIEELKEKMADAFNSPLLLNNPTVSVPSNFEIGE